jgi:Txe/YoeB family toxin of Txe-Axe toxin-antitoxin module
MTPLQALELVGIDPTPATHLEYVDNWLKLSELAKALAAMEMVMRKALFASTFPEPTEGANNYPLPDGRKIAAQHKLNYSIDESQIALARAEYEVINDRPVLFDELLKVKHDLVTSAYRKLQPASGQAPSQAFVAVSRMVTIKPGSPTIEIR